MGKLLNIVTPLHKSTPRKYLDRMVDDKVGCMLKAKEYGFDYWDGDRRFGYGGYKYDGRWKPVAEALIKEYNLTEKSKILDVGCGKGFLIYELQKLLPEVDFVGLDKSIYALTHTPEAIIGHVMLGRAESPYPFKDKEFDLVISLGCLHNLKLQDFKKAIQEIERVGKQKYVMFESYRNEQEQFNLQCWAKTAETELSKDTWEWLFKEWGYTGDYEFIYFEKGGNMGKLLCKLFGHTYRSDYWHPDGSPRYVCIRCGKSDVDQSEVFKK